MLSSLSCSEASFDSLDRYSKRADIVPGTAEGHRVTN